MRLEEALKALYARGPRGIRLGIESVDEVCAALWRPERSYRVVHVAGTNGKGSVCALTESMAREAGLKTGLFTSPHLARFSERIRVNGEELADWALADAIAEALAAGPKLSFFEASTVAAFVAFRNAGVDLAVIEVGLGGRLDASNVVQPEVSAITSIGLDHVEFLGDSLAKIAFEKAGIMRAGVPCIVGKLPDEARAMIETQASARATPLVHAPPCSLSFDDVGVRGLRGTTNLDVAVAIARTLQLPDESVVRGAKNARWPGRFEYVDADDGRWLFDGAHNFDGAARLAEELDARSESPAVLLFGAMADKPAVQMASLLRTRCINAVYTEPLGRAPIKAAVLAEAADGYAESDVRAAISRARQLAGPEGLVLCAGSLYLVGDVRSKVLGLPQDPPIAM